jgi:hypothetical protein
MPLRDDQCVAGRDREAVANGDSEFGGLDHTIGRQ